MPAIAKNNTPLASYNGQIQITEKKKCKGQSNKTLTNRAIPSRHQVKLKRVAAPILKTNSYTT